MSMHLERAVQILKKKILSLSALVEESFYNSVKAIRERDELLATSIIKGDKQIDREEVEIEEECLKVLALHQPVAIDLRFIIAVLKINNDLERIGDHAANIAHYALELSKLDPIPFPRELDVLADRSKLMLHNALESLVTLNLKVAREVCASDHEVNEMNRAMYRKVKDEMKNQPHNVDALSYILSLSKSLERISDLATNIAEDVIYMINGEIVRHRQAG